jgi:hypothetical protein
MQHVAVGDLVFLAFDPQLPHLARAGFAAALGLIIAGNRLGTGEAVTPEPRRVFVAQDAHALETRVQGD